MFDIDIIVQIGVFLSDFCYFILINHISDSANTVKVDTVVGSKSL